MASYTSVTVSSYNASPPSDDGSTASTNKITWSGLKTKLTDPLNTAIASINTNLISAGAIWDGLIVSGTLMLFQQTSAPTGWTKQTTHNDKALRVVSGTASSGGSTAFTTVFTSRTIAQANLPSVNFTVSGTAASHTHGAGSYAVGTGITLGTPANNCVSSGGSGASGWTSGGSGGSITQTATLNSGTVSGSSSASGTLALSATAASGGSGTALDFAVQYVDLIIASKD